MNGLLEQLPRADTTCTLLSRSLSVSFSLPPTEMWIDGDPPGNSFISRPPPFAQLEIRGMV